MKLKKPRRLERVVKLDDIHSISIVKPTRFTFYI
jgi:hypothetical protein